MTEEREIDALRKERDLLKAELATARGTCGELNDRCAHWRNEAEVLASRRNGALAERDVARADLAETQALLRARDEDLAGAFEACAKVADLEAERIKHDANFFGLGDERLEKVAHDIAAAIRAAVGGAK